MRKPNESWEGYVYRKQERLGEYAQLKGIEPFNELFSKGIITPFITAIRVMYTNSLDTVYNVNAQGRLVDVVRGDVFLDEGIDPTEILSEEKCQYWWEVEGIKPKGYDERRKAWEGKD